MSGPEAAIHASMLHVMPGEATSPNLYPYVWLKFGGKWVPFQSRVEQEGYNDVFFGYFPIWVHYFSIHMKQLHAYITRDILTSLRIDNSWCSVICALSLVSETMSCTFSCHT